MIPLAIWLFLIGYTIAIAGKRNLGVSFQPQPDGSIKATDGQGNDARTYSLLDVVTCAPASQAPAGASAKVPSGTQSLQLPGVTYQVSTDCKQRPGDTRIPLPAGHYMLWRPLGSGIGGQLNGQLIGPC